MLTIGGDPTMSLAQIWIAGFFVGAVNGAVGVAFTWGLSRIISVVFQWTRDRAVAQQLLPTANHTKPEATHPSGKCRSVAG